MTQQAARDTGPSLTWSDQLYELRDVDGDKVGDVIEANPDYLLVETSGGFLGLGERNTYYVPMSAVQQGSGSYALAIDKDELQSMGWDQVPVQSDYASEQWQAQMRQDYPEYATTTEQPQATRLVRWEEELQATTAERQAGEVVVTKDIVEEMRTISVPVRREEVHIERHAVTGDVPAGAAFTDQQTTVRVPVMEEQIELRKVARPVEEIEISTTAVQETREVQGTVRREEFQVADSTKVSGTGQAGTSQVDPSQVVDDITSSRS